VLILGMLQSLWPKSLLQYSDGLHCRTGTMEEILTLELTSSALEVKIQRMNSIMNFSRPHPSDREQRGGIDHNSTHKQCGGTVKIYISIVNCYRANARYYDSLTN
jgi:hypothetical protein